MRTAHRTDLDLAIRLADGNSSRTSAKLLRNRGLSLDYVAHSQQLLVFFAAADRPGDAACPSHGMYRNEDSARWICEARYIAVPVEELFRQVTISNRL